MKKHSLSLDTLLIVLVLVVSSLVLLGWTFGLSSLVQIYKEFAPMQFNTALCFLLLSGALLLSRLNANKMAQCLALFCLAIAAVTGSQYLYNFNIGIDEIFMTAYITVKTSHPGRMSPITSLCFTFFSIYSLIGYLKLTSSIARIIKVLFVLPVLYFSLTAVIRYIMGESSPYAWQIYTQMAVHTSFCFLCFSVYAINGKVKKYPTEDQTLFQYSALTSFFVFFIFVFFSTNLNKSEQKVAQAFFSEEANSIKKKVELTLNLQVKALERMASRIGNDSYPSAREFNQDASQYIKHFNNFQAIEWVNQQNIIEWIVPTQGNEAVIGKDLNKESKRNYALQNAIANKKPVFSPIIDLIQGGKGLLLFIPIFTQQQQPKGYLVAVYKLDHLISNLIGPSFKTHQIELFQNENSISLLKQKAPTELANSEQINIRDFGINWDLKVSRKSHQLFASQSYYPELILLLGTLVSLFIGNMIFLSLKILSKNKEIKHFARVKTDFLANMSHEIRTPLNGVIGIAELLSESLETKENQNKVNLLKQSAHSLLSLVNDILDLSKFEDGHVILERNNFNLQDTSSEVIQLFDTIAKEKGIDLRASIEKDVETQLNGDKNRIKQILSNLISNAIKFTNNGEVYLHIRNSTDSNAETHVLEFVIKDTGIGIAPEKQIQMFDKFTQADSSTSRKYGGTGLGLSICKSLVEQMNGQIDLESEEGVGTTIKVTLPLEYALEEINIEPKGIRDLPEASSFHDFKILTAEDNEINQFVIKGMIKKVGFSTDLASNGNQVLHSLSQNNYDLIFMDCQMPYLDGYETALKINEQYGKERPTIIAITASSNEDDIKKCYSSGMDFVISKPIDFESLKEHLLRELSAKKSLKKVS